MFADVRNYTRLMREHGPQVVTPLIDDFVRRARDAVIANDGILDRYLGDAVLSLFNVPVRHADHVQRAVNTALEIQAIVPKINERARGQNLVQVGIGINTGVAFTGIVGSTSCDDYTALGDAINIASRLQSEAAPGEVIVTADVYRHVRDQYPNAVEKSLNLKGIDEPVTAYVVTAT
jgi:class 3 adenylate cyclase